MPRDGERCVRVGERLDCGNEPGSRARLAGGPSRSRAPYACAMRVPRPSRESCPTAGYISRRASSARPSVTSSAYSRSPPTGSPLAIRVTLMPSGLMSRARYSAVVSPSTFGFVATTTSVTVAVAEALDELADAQLLGPDAVDGRDRAVQHVVEAVELAGALDRDEVARLLDDADHAACRARGRRTPRTARPRRS